MQNQKLYFDEDISVIWAVRLRKMGWDVLTTQQAGCSGKDDVDQLKFASQQNRILITRNYVDFQNIHEQILAEGKSHSGIIICFWRPEVQKMFEALISILEKNLNEDWSDRLVYA